MMMMMMDAIRCGSLLRFVGRCGGSQSGRTPGVPCLTRTGAKQHHAVGKSNGTRDGRT